MTATPSSTSRWQPLILAILGLAAPAAVWTASAQVTVDPWRRGALAVASFLVVLVAGFVSKVWEKLNSRWVDACANWVDRKTRLFFSTYRRRYLKYLGYKHRSFDVKGLSTQGAHSIEIEQVFVELSVDPRSPTGIKSDPITSSAGERHTIWDYLELSRAEGANLAVIGAPGCGKTTLLKHLALMLSAKRERRFRAFTPFLLFLRDHAKAIQEDAQLTLTAVISNALNAADLKPPDGWLQNELDRGRGLILLDGLDEVADPDLRRLVVEWVERQMTRHGNDRFIVTSRPFGYRSNPLAGVTVLQVLSFTWPQVERFVSKWYLATETVAAGKKDPGVDMAARDGAADLMRRLRGNPPLSDLAVNPLLLTMIATVHRYRSTLPGRRVELYYEICEVFLGKRQQARGISLDFTPEQKKRVLEPLAWVMMLGKKREIGREDAASAIAEALSLVTASLSPDDFLRNVEESSGLLLERENGIYTFAHLTFQEYLAASHAKERGLQDQLAVYTDDTWWHETLRLFAAQSDATGIVAACLDNVRSATALALALECGEEARELQPAVRARLDQVLTKEIESHDRERSRIVGEALLTRRLRSLVRLDEHRYIDDTLITHAEYQVFLDELRGRSEFRQPDHWSTYTYPSDSAKKPVVGVRPSDAEEFCRWLTSRERGVWSYRIPRVEELEGEQGVSGWTVGFWALSKAGPECMTPANTNVQGAIYPHARFEEFVSHNASLGTALDQALSDALELDPRGLSIALQFIRDFVTDIGNLDRDFGNIERSLRSVHLLGLVHDRNRYLVRNLITDLDRVLVLVRDVDVRLARGCDRNYCRALDLDLRDSLAEAITYEHRRAFKRAPDSHNFDIAINLVIKRALDRQFPRFHNSARDQARALVLLLAKYFSKFPDETRSIRAGFLIRGIINGDSISLNYSLPDSVLELFYLPLAVVQLRIDGHLSAFEGIRIMKSREPER
jgi:energy-coupling factor transporter ATP-binding protein EcfA2